MHLELAGYGAALGATIVWAGNFVAARALADAIPPCQFNFWRWLIALIALLPFAWPSLKRDIIVARRHVVYLSILGILGVTLMNSFVYKAGESAESLTMALIMPATPAVILVLARIFYGERISWNRLAGMCAAMTGIGVLLSRGNLQTLVNFDFRAGDLWTLAAMLCFAAYSLLMRKRSEQITPAGFNVIVFFLGLLYSLPPTLAEIYLDAWPTLSWPLLFGILYAGLGCSAIAFWLWTIGIDRIGPVRAGIIYYSLPLFAAIMGNIILGETISKPQVLGGALIIGGIVLATFPGGHSNSQK